MTPRDYPDRVEDVLDLEIAFDPRLIQSVKRFAEAKPWRGTVEQRRQKFLRFHAELAKTLGVTPPRLIFARSDASDSSRSCYIPSLDTIVLQVSRSLPFCTNGVISFTDRARQPPAVGRLTSSRGASPAASLVASSMVTCCGSGIRGAADKRSRRQCNPCSLDALAKIADAIDRPVASSRHPMSG